ncbi:hypothetical protein ACFL08_04625 [Patescibacteria group bacterium]
MCAMSVAQSGYRKKLLKNRGSSGGAMMGSEGMPQGGSMGLGGERSGFKIRVKATDALIYGGALFLALFKDFILDYVGLGSLPVIGTVTTAMIAGAIFILFWFDGMSAAKGMVRRMVVFGIGSAIEGFVVGVNFAPIETLTVIIVYMMVLKSRMN